jgi:hypothetical protein
MKKHWFIWIPRALAILTAVFMLMMSFDSFEGNESLGTKLLGFLMHNIPFLAVALFIWLTWKRPLIAGIIFLALAAFYIIAVVIPRDRWDWIPVALFPFITGTAYLTAHFLDKR